MLKVDHLVKNYHQQCAVDRVSFEVRPGRIFGLLGPNGAGKSSLLRMITGITLPDAGEVLFNNEQFDPSLHTELIGYMPEERGLYKKMKVREHMLYLGQLKGLKKAAVNQKIDYWFEKLNMKSWEQKKVEDLSKGMSQKLQFVGTVLHEPQLLILDEPFSGLDPVNSKIIKDEIFELAQKGLTIIFSTHRMEQVEEVCQDIVLMNNGAIILEGEVNKIKQEHKQNHYFIKTQGELNLKNADFIDKNFVHGVTEAVIALNQESESQELLNRILKEGNTILHFEEILPSLNNIFISLVEKSAVRSFQTK